jgi:hypothetical protein
MNVIGSGLATGGNLPTNKQKNFLRQALPKNHGEMYHKILSMSNHDWENMRETAAKVRGYKHSNMWHSIKQGGDMGMKAPAMHYERIIGANHPSIAAKMVEHEFESGNGGGLFDALNHSMKLAVNSYPEIRKMVEPILSNEQLQKAMPAIGQYAQPTVKFLDRVLKMGAAQNRHPIRSNELVPEGTGAGPEVEPRNDLPLQQERIDQISQPPPQT